MEWLAGGGERPGVVPIHNLDRRHPVAASTGGRVDLHKVAAANPAEQGERPVPVAGDDTVTPLPREGAPFEVSRLQPEARPIDPFHDDRIETETDDPQPRDRGPRGRRLRPTVSMDLRVGAAGAGGASAGAACMALPGLAGPPAWLLRRPIVSGSSRPDGLRKWLRWNRRSASIVGWSRSPFVYAPGFRRSILARIACASPIASGEV